MNQRGVSLIVAMAASALLVSILAAAAATQHYRLKAEKNRIDKRNATIAAQAGIQRALVEFEDIDINKVTLSDTWATTTTRGDQRFIVGNTSFRFEIIDASSFINLNTVTETMLQNLNLTEEQIECLLDWRGTETTPRANGAKDEYYNTLTNPYNTKLGNFDTIDELLLVKGFTSPDLYELQTNTTATVPKVPLYLMLTVDSQCPNTNASGAAKLNPNNAQMQEMTQAGVSQALAQRIVTMRTTRQFSSLDDLLSMPGITVSEAASLLEAFSLNTATVLDGRINLNTAPESVIQTLPGITTDIVNAILSYQESGFTTLTDLGNVAGMTTDLLRQWADLITIGSQTFIIRSVGTAGGTSVTLEAVVKINNGTATIVKYLNSPYPDMPTKWEWDTEVSNETILVSNE